MQNKKEKIDYELEAVPRDGLSLTIKIRCPICMELVSPVGEPVSLSYMNDRHKEATANGYMFLRPGEHGCAKN